MILILILSLIILTPIVWFVAKIFAKLGIGFIIIGINFLIMFGTVTQVFIDYHIKDLPNIILEFILLTDKGLEVGIAIFSTIQFITTIIAVNEQEKKDKEKSTQDYEKNKN